MKSVSPEANLWFDGAPGRQRPQRPHLGAHRVLATPVPAGDAFVDEAAPVGEICEVAGAAQDQSLIEGDLEVVVVGLDRAVLMRLPGSVAAREHAVVGAEGLVAIGDVGRSVSVEVAISGGEAVGAVLVRHASQGPQCVL